MSRDRPDMRDSGARRPGSDPPRLAPGARAPRAETGAVLASPMSLSQPTGRPASFLEVAGGRLPQGQARFGQNLFNRSMEPLGPLRLTRRTQEGVPSFMGRPRGEPEPAQRKPRAAGQGDPVGMETPGSFSRSSRGDRSRNDEPSTSSPLK